MINKRALLVEVRCTLISLNFYLFQNNFASLRGPKWVLFRLKKILLEALYWLTAPRKYPSVIICSQDEEESTPDFTQNHHGCVVTSNGLPAMIFYICSLKL